MKLKILLPLLVAGVLGLAAAYLAFSLVSGKPEPVAVEKPKYLNLITSATSIEPGTRLDGQHLTSIRVEASQDTAGKFTRVDDVRGKVATTFIPAGQILIDAQLAPADSPAGIQALLPPGMRAVNLHIDDATSAANFIMPGTRIDLIGRIPGGNGHEDVARAIVQNIKVMAVGTRMSAAAMRAPTSPAAGGEPPKPARTITVEVTVEQANALELAHRSGANPRVVIRPHGDEETVDVAGVTLTALRGDASDDSGFDDNLREFNLGDPEFGGNAGGLFGKTEPAADLGRKPAGFREITVIRGGVETSVRVPVAPEADTEAARPAGGFDLASMLGELLPDLPKAGDKNDKKNDTPRTPDAGITTAGGLDAPIDE